MNKSLAVILIVGLVQVFASDSEVQNDHSKTVSVEDSQGVSSFDALAVFYGKQSQCYRCTAPCSAYQCCPGSYPQCCYINGLGCRCCAR